MQQAAPAAAPSFAAASTGSASAGVAMTTQSGGNDEVVAAYQAQLEEAYKALQDAYTQIDVLQNAQPQMAVATFMMMITNTRVASLRVANARMVKGNMTMTDRKQSLSQSQT